MNSHKMKPKGTPMKKTAISFTTLLAAFFLVPLSAQQRPQPRPPGQAEATAANMINIRGVSMDSVFTPEYSYNLRGQSTRRDGRASWLQVSMEFDTAPNWIDEMTFTFYVVLRGNARDLPEGSPEVNMFSGSVTYMNVKQGRHTATMFLDPNTFERYGSPEGLAVTVQIDGNAAGGRVEPQRTAESRWWTTQTPLPISLMRRDETPFVFVEIEQNPTIKP